MLCAAGMPRNPADPTVAILHQGARYCVRHLCCTAQRRAVVVFENWLPRPSLDGQLTAEAFFRHRGINMIGIRAAANDWYLHEEIDAALDAVRGAVPSFDLVGYGGSMGGYAAINLSEALGLRSVIAVCPQYALDPARAPYDGRWRGEAARVAAEGGFARDRIDQIGLLAGGWLIYDPACVDGLHAADIGRHHTMGALRLRFAGHHLMLMLQQAGLYTDMLTAMLEDRFDPAAFRREWRKARRGSSAFWLGLSYALRLRGDHAAALRAALLARHSPHPEPPSLDMAEACARIGLGTSQDAEIRRLAAPWASDPVWGEAARWCLSQVPVGETTPDGRVDPSGP